MTQLLMLCRSGYEPELEQELTHCLAAMNLSGYASYKKGQAWLVYTLFNVPSDIFTQPAFLAMLRQLIFARQIWQCLDEVKLADDGDRVSPLIAAFEDHRCTLSLVEDVQVEYADSATGRDLARFTKKFTVPLRSALRANKLIKPRQKQKAKQTTPVAMVLFTASHHCMLGVGINTVTKSEIGGIIRLRMPNDAPSRSTLKLEDAISTLLTAQERAAIFTEGATAVDLGACPGGWTYQLVKRGMHVEAIDNGDIAESLMRTGQVSHFQHDGFSYQPQYGRVTLLVCDMIEQPGRVAQLMAKWLRDGKAEHAIFNLKLPMKQRYQEVDKCLNKLKSELKNKKLNFRFGASHLYHDRDEITVAAIRLTPF